MSKIGNYVVEADRIASSWSDDLDASLIRMGASKVKNINKPWDMKESRLAWAMHRAGGSNLAISWALDRKENNVKNKINQLKRAFKTQSVRSIAINPASYFES